MSSEGTTDNRRTTNSAHTNTTNKNRDKRFLASLQSALGGESSRRHEIRPKNLETEEESTLTLSNALQKISLSNEGIADSVADVREFLDCFFNIVFLYKLKIQNHSLCKEQTNFQRMNLINWQMYSSNLL